MTRINYQMIGTGNEFYDAINYYLQITATQQS